MSERTHPTPSTDPVESITVREADLTVRKTIVHYRDNVVKVEFTISSVADEPLSLQLIDQLPEQIGAESVGFHPDYDPDAWSVGEGREVRYETVVEAGEERETVYGAQVDALDDLERFTVEPRVEIEPTETDVPEPNADTSDPNTADGDTSGMVQNPASIDDGATGAMPTGSIEQPLQNESVATADDRVEASERDGRSEPRSQDSQVADRADGSSELERSAPPVTKGTRDPLDGHSGSPIDTGSAESTNPGGSVIGAMVTELQRGELTDDEQTVIRDELGLEDGSPSDQVRLDHIQEVVTDLVAYRDALEGFIDEHGPAEALVDEFQTALEDHEADIDRLEGSVDDLQSKFESFEENRAADLKRVESRLSSVENELSGELMALEEDLESIQEDLDRIKEWREKLSVAAQLADAGVGSESTTN